MKDISIRNINEQDVPAVACLLRQLAVEFIVPELTPEAGRYFLEQNDEAALRSKLAQGFVYHVAVCEGKIAGFIGMRGRSHVFHMFVGSAWQRRGLARALWDHARQLAQEDGHDGVFTVNASNFAVPVYAAMGFAATAAMQCANGVLFNPMRYGPADPALAGS